jgi:hypothetical protein
VHHGESDGGTRIYAVPGHDYREHSDYDLGARGSGGDQAGGAAVTLAQEKVRIVIVIVKMRTLFFAIRFEVLIARKCTPLPCPS